MSATSHFASLTGRFVHSPRSRPGPFTAAAHPRPALGVRQSETGTRIRVIFAAGSGHRERDQPRDPPRPRHPRRGPARARVRPRRPPRRHVCPDRRLAATLVAWTRVAAHRPGGVRSPPHARSKDERTANIVAGRPQRLEDRRRGRRRLHPGAGWPDMVRLVPDSSMCTSLGSMPGSATRSVQPSSLEVISVAGLQAAAGGPARSSPRARPNTSSICRRSGPTHVRQKPPTCRDVGPCAAISPPVGPWAYPPTRVRSEFPNIGALWPHVGHEPLCASHRPFRAQSSQPAGAVHSRRPPAARAGRSSVRDRHAYSCHLRCGFWSP